MKQILIQKIWLLNLFQEIYIFGEGGEGRVRRLEAPKIEWCLQNISLLSYITPTEMLIKSNGRRQCNGVSVMKLNYLDI